MTRNRLFFGAEMLLWNLHMMVWRLKGRRFGEKPFRPNELVIRPAPNHNDPKWWLVL